MPDLRVVDLEEARKEAEARRQEVLGEEFVDALEKKGFRVMSLPGRKFNLEAGPFDSLDHLAAHLHRHGWVPGHGHDHPTPPPRAV